MSLSSFGDNGRNGGKKQLSPNMILLLVGIFVILPMSGLFGLLWTAVAAVLLVKQAKKQGENGEKPSAPLSPRRESKGPALSISGPAKRTYQSVTRPAPRKQEQHDHIQSTCLGQAGRLEQLETLRKAGLYTNEEYRKKKEEILRGK